ncbi:hypothetical protein F5144DRAFT_39018 [Chaetomium tenue]|uniref:Uncharacterized protein n=1 Tax=Chaetomium tenue TaxID=1854479 RepID=A0ACB7PN03_9PEZI|nr:hypothetical protein F5144DRAFT_39018 [Chaetomium globosum]
MFRLAAVSTCLRCSAILLERDSRPWMARWLPLQHHDLHTGRPVVIWGRWRCLFKPSRLAASLGDDEVPGSVEPCPWSRSCWLTGKLMFGPCGRKERPDTRCPDAWDPSSQRLLRCDSSPVRTKSGMFGGLDPESHHLISNMFGDVICPINAIIKNCPTEKRQQQKKKNQEADRQFVGEWRVSPKSSTCRNLQAIGGNLQHLGSLQVQTTGHLLPLNYPMRQMMYVPQGGEGILHCAVIKQDREKLWAACSVQCVMWEKEEKKALGNFNLTRSIRPVLAAGTVPSGGGFARVL